MTNPLYDQLFGKHAGKTSPFLRLSDGRTITHTGFLDIAAQIANHFAKVGLRPGDRVAVQVDKSPEALAVYAACVQAGLVFLPLNTAYTLDELSYFLEDAAAAVLVVDSKRETALEDMAARQGTRLETLNADGTGSLTEAASREDRAFDTAERKPSDLTALVYTSGTTGRSKGAMLSQSNLLSNARTLVEAWRFTSDDILLHALPIFHTHGLFVATNVTLMAGGSMIFLPGFDIDEIARLLPRSTVLMGVPTFYTRLLRYDGFTADLASGVRLFTSGSAPLLPETHIEFERLTGHKIIERYGMTETNMNTSNPYDGDRRAGTVGYPLPGVEISITDPDTGAAVPAGEIGMIEVRGPNVFGGYWNRPEKTAAELRETGFFITGDLGKIDDDGYVHIVGRAKDLIISGGYNIYPKEIESVLDSLPEVLESAVIGIPDADFGEAVVALAVAAPGHKIENQRALSSVRDSLARFKHPRVVLEVDELPRNTLGKVQKNVLRDRYASLDLDTLPK